MYSMQTCVIIFVVLGNFGVYCNVFNIVYPGTKWCGYGNVAKNEADLGEDKATDSCCREHDECPKFINSFETKYGLRNNHFITKQHCSCNKRFYDCLKKQPDIISNNIGTFYFNILQLKCFDLKCAANVSDLWNDCKKFEKKGEYTWYRFNTF